MKRFALIAVIAAALAAAIPAVAAAAPPPSGATGIALQGKVELAWQPAAGATGYTVYRGTSAGAITTLLTPASGVAGTTFSDTTAVNGTTYYYVVRAVDLSGESADSLTVQATPKARACSSGNRRRRRELLPGKHRLERPERRCGRLRRHRGFRDGIERQQGRFRRPEGQHAEWRHVPDRDLPDGLLRRQRRAPLLGDPWAPRRPPARVHDRLDHRPDRLLELESLHHPDHDLLVAVGHLPPTPRARGQRLRQPHPPRRPRRREQLPGRLRHRPSAPSRPTTTTAGSRCTTSTRRVERRSPARRARSRSPTTGRTSSRAPACATGTRAPSSPLSSGSSARATTSRTSPTPTSSRAAALSGRKAYISPAHDEYVSSGMRAAMQGARDSGVELFFSGANEIYWRIRFESGGRVQVCYKTTQSGGADPSGIPTGTWRDPAGANNPENALTGVMYVGDADNTYFPLVVSAAEGTDRIYRYTGLDTQAPGTSTSIGSSLVGWEWDARAANGQEPAGLKTLASSPVTGQLIQGNGAFTTPGSATVHTVKYTAASGALVFSTGTNHWNRGLAANAAGAGEPNQIIQQITTNVLADMGAVPQTPAGDIVLDAPTADGRMPRRASAPPPRAPTASPSRGTRWRVPTATTSTGCWLREAVDSRSGRSRTRRRSPARASPTRASLLRRPTTTSSRRSRRASSRSPRTRRMRPHPPRLVSPPASTAAEPAYTASTARVVSCRHLLDGRLDLPGLVVHGDRRHERSGPLPRRALGPVQLRGPGRERHLRRPIPLRRAVLRRLGARRSW